MVGVGFVMTHVHHVVKDDKCGALCLGFIPQAYLTNGAVPPEELVEIIASDLVVEVFDKQDPVCAWRQLRLSFCGSDVGSG